MSRQLFDIDEIEGVAGFPIETGSLFEVDFNALEGRILELAWVKSVSFKKQLPSKLVVRLVLRNPIALLQTDDGELYYFDVMGKVMGHYRPEHELSLPIITGVSPSNGDLVHKVGALLEARGYLNAQFQLSGVSVGEDSKKVLFQYYRSQKIDDGGPNRFVMESNLDLVRSGEDLWQRFTKVVEYLQKNKINARHLLLLDRKKIVVRSNRHS